MPAKHKRSVPSALRPLRLLPLTALAAMLVLLGTLLPQETLARERIEVRYSRNFSIDYRDNYTLVTVHNAWPDSPQVFRYLLKPRGSAVPEGVDDAQIIDIPVRRSLIMSTTFVAFMEQLGLIDRIVGFSDLQRVHSAALQQAAAAGKVTEVGMGSEMRIETIFSLEPELIFAFASGGFYDVHPKLLEAGHKVAVCADYMEEHPLGRAEWIKFFALFFGREAEANRIFAALEQRYLALAQLTGSCQKRPTVVTGVPFQGRWYAAGGNSYIARFLADAGSDYVWRDTDYSGSRPLDIEVVFERALDADFWLNTGTWTSLRDAGQSDPRLTGISALQDQRVYNNRRRLSASGSNDIWESGIMAPDLILEDLISIFHPQLLPGHQLYYYQKLQ